MQVLFILDPCLRGDDGGLWEDGEDMFLRKI